MSVNVNALDKILPYEVEIVKRISKKESLVVLARGLPVEKERISRFYPKWVICGQLSVTWGHSWGHIRSRKFWKSKKDHFGFDKTILWFNWSSSYFKRNKWRYKSDRSWMFLFKYQKCSSKYFNINSKETNADIWKRRRLFYFVTGFNSRYAQRSRSG